MADATRLRTGLTEWAFAVFDRATADMPDLIRPSAPVSTPTPTSTGAPGQLRDSINRSEAPTPGSTRFRAVVAAPVPQARYTDQGTEPHEIWPHGGQGRDGYPLRFYWIKKGGIVKSYGWHGQPMGMVEHPGNPARPWWRDAVTRAFSEALDRAASSTSL